MSGRSDEQSQGWVSWSVWIFGAIAYAALTFATPRVTPTLRAEYGFNLCILMLIGITSGMLGWGLGIFLSPIGVQRKVQNYWVQRLLRFGLV